jgi:hypothetical protein
MVLIVRVSGKRSLASLALRPGGHVALGSTLATVLLSRGVALAEGVLAFGMLAILQWAVSRIPVSNAGFRDLVRAAPRLPLENGEYRLDAMAQEPVTAGEIGAAVRNAGHGRLEAIAAAVLESGGSIERDRRRKRRGADRPSFCPEVTPARRTRRRIVDRHGGPARSGLRRRDEQNCHLLSRRPALSFRRPVLILLAERCAGSSHI